MEAAATTAIVAASAVVRFPLKMRARQITWLVNTPLSHIRTPRISDMRLNNKLAARLT